MMKNKALQKTIRAGSLALLSSFLVLGSIAPAYAGAFPPVANAGPDAVYTADASGTVTVTLVGRGSYEPEAFLGEEIVSWV